MTITLSEAEIKQACEEYLAWQMNLGNLWFTRLNAGDFIETRGNTRRRIKGAGKGTADLLVIQPVKLSFGHLDKCILEHHTPRVTFLEIKSFTGKQSPVQFEFERMVTGLYCRYYIVKSLEAVVEILKE